MIVLGITHPISWNNAACILVDGRFEAMVEEERLCRIKHAPRMAPKLAIDYCLRHARISANQVDYVAVGFDTAVRAAVNSLRRGGLPSALKQAAYWLHDGSKYKRKLSLDAYGSQRTVFVNHHLAHASSAFFASGFPEAAILSLDGSGGSESGVLAIGRGTESGRQGNAQFSGWGREIIAPAGGRVVYARNDVPDNPPDGDPRAVYSKVSEPLLAIAGNCIIIDHGNGEFSALMHLQRGSVTVEVGSTVRRGQIIARLGNSGDAFGAHLHYQLQEGPDLFRANSLPVKFSNLAGIDPARGVYFEPR